MLKIQEKNNPKLAVWLLEPQISIGSAATNQLVLKGADVISHHADITVKGESLELRPVSSENIKINTQPVTGKQVLVAGDILEIAGTELLIIDPKRQRRERVAKTVHEDESNSNGVWALRANHQALGNKVYKLKACNSLGRSIECDITISAAHLSRRHAELTVKNDTLFVRDLGSANGTFLNGERITEARVKRGDELRFDSLSFGVIGPVDDFDKTTVRSALSVEPMGGNAKAGAAKKSLKPRIDDYQYGVEPVSDNQAKGVLLILGAVSLLAMLGYLLYLQDII